jgi:GTPase SAR1 family protein
MGMLYFVLVPVMAKICVIGDTNRGKSLWVKSVRSGLPINRVQNYGPTMGVEIFPIALPVGAPFLVAKLWDCAGLYSGPASALSTYYGGADAAIIFVNNRNEADMWFHKFRSVAPGALLVICNRLADEDGDGMLAYSDTQMARDPLRPLRALGYA